MPQYPPGLHVGNTGGFDSVFNKRCAARVGNLTFDRACHVTDGPPKMGPPGPSVANYVAMDGPPDQVRLPQMVPRTICGAVSGPPLPQMVPLKLSLEMMSRGSYEVNLANMDHVTDYNYHLFFIMHCFMQ